MGTSSKLRTYHLLGHVNTGQSGVAEVHFIKGEYRAHTPAGAILQYLKSVSVFDCPYINLEARPALTNVVRFR